MRLYRQVLISLGLITVSVAYAYYVNFIWPNNYQVGSYRVRYLPPWLGLRQGAFTCVGRQVEGRSVICRERHQLPTSTTR